MKIQLYCNVDDAGNIVESLSGANIIPSEPYTFFFMVEVKVAENIINYKVVLNSMKPALVLKEGGTVE